MKTCNECNSSYFEFQGNCPICHPKPLHFKQNGNDILGWTTYSGVNQSQNKCTFCNSGLVLTTVEGIDMCSICHLYVSTILSSQRVKDREEWIKDMVDSPFNRVTNTLMRILPFVALGLLALMLLTK